MLSHVCWKLSQANQMINEEDKAFQSRLLLIPFSSLVVTGEEDPNMYNQWLMIRELISALMPDFASLLVHGKLDAHAIRDCATFLQAAIGRKRDRNANMWALLLYFMLVLNMLFQETAESQEAIFEWMIKAVTRATYELNNHQSPLDQFVLSVNKCLTVRSNPLGRENEVIFWHNYRTTCSPVAPVFTTATSSPTLWFAFRLEPTVNVLKTVLGKNFSVVELNRMIDECSWAVRGKGMFYDCATNSWPICNVIHDSDTHVNTQARCVTGCRCSTVL
jgi:hypothetical protein